MYSRIFSTNQFVKIAEQTKILLNHQEDFLSPSTARSPRAVGDAIRANISEVLFVPIEFMDWDCLTIGSLGWGQIQIANASHINIRPHYSRKAWMLELCDVMLAFYPKEISKISERTEYFEQVRRHWQSKAS